VSGCGKEAASERVMARETAAKAEKRPSILAERPVVLHGFGYIDGHMVTNSTEAFPYDRGFRVFEVDLQMTSDDRWIAVMIVSLSTING
jgi:glycerophosphoryl diester phosphodiesterase